MVVEHDVAVKVRDGCALYCDIYRPAHSEKVPAIVCWSPFGKKHNGISMMKRIPWGVGVPEGCLSGLERFEGPDPAEYVPRGFAVVNVDARGAGDSDGTIVITGTQEGEDGHDIIEELAKMDWCNGSVGLAGHSHLGIVQWFIAAQQPPSLKAIAPWEACGDLYREQFVRGGAWDNGLFDLIIQQTIRGRHGLEDFREMYRRSNTMNPYWEDKRADMKKIKIPAYIVASYSTFVHTMGSIRGWLELDTEDKWLRWDPYQEWYDLWAVPESRDELSRFFGKYLKGEDNGWETTPKIRSCILRFGDDDPIYPVVEDAYPIPRTQYKTYYFTSGGRLSDQLPENDGVVAYDSENTTKSADFAGFSLKFDRKTRLVGLPRAVIHVSCDDLDDLVVYILIRKLDNKGREMHNLNIPWHAAPYKKMADIPASELSNLLIYYGPLGVLRASHREIDPSKSIHPQYPFHTHSNVQKVPRGEIVKLEIGLWAMGIEFDEGQSLRVQVSGQYPLVPEFKHAKPPPVEDRNRGMHKVHFGRRHQSRVILPFV